jgi:hypothetical protein
MNDLNNFSTIRRTDKFDLGYVDLFYNDLFAKKQLSTTSVLEIGVDQGQSILLWRDYFQNAQIYALDINPKPQSLVIDSDRITYCQIDAYRHESVADLRQFGKGELFLDPKLEQAGLTLQERLQQSHLAMATK